MELVKDIWRAGIVSATMPTILARGSVAGLPVTWLPSPGPLRYLADPFGLWRDGRLHVFTELYDYRVRVGAIEAMVFDAGFRLLEQRRVLAEPWHLSYPFVFEAEGETWMLPEANRSRTLTLYRAVEFPFRWEAAHRPRAGSHTHRCNTPLPCRPLVAVLYLGDATRATTTRRCAFPGRSDSRARGTRCPAIPCVSMCRVVAPAARRR